MSATTTTTNGTTAPTGRGRRSKMPATLLANLLTRCSATAKLSQHQRVILMTVYEATVQAEERAAAPGVPVWWRWTIDDWGVEWWPSTWWPNVKPASISRSLRELEARGLLLRQNMITGTPGIGRCRKSIDDPAPRRCTHVLLTEQGREVAKLLISHVTQDINSLQEG